MRFSILSLVALSLIIFTTGCGSSESRQADSSPDESTPAESSSVAEGATYLLNTEPESALGVIEVRKQAADGDPVVIAGRIGGSENPWIEGRAAFSIVDGSLQACSDIPGDGCPKPWDYCCETSKLPGATALVKVVDADGELVAVDARELLDVKELSTVVVQGKAQRDESGNLTVLADGLFVKSN